MIDDKEVLEGFAHDLDIPVDELVERWSGCPDQVMEDIFRIPDMDTGKFRDLELFDVQRKVVHAYFYGDAPEINLYKGRRIGYSFIIVLCFLVEAMFKPKSFYPLVSRTKPQAANRVGDIEMLINNAKVEIPTPKANVNELRLWNGSGFMAFSGDPDTSRGDESARSVMLDEAAFIEDQPKAARAFGAFIALGKDRTMVQVSTPNVSNDKFMRDHRAGTATGRDENGNPCTLSIKQPTFYNAGEIDVNQSLFEQDVEPVRPDINLHQIERDRASDPEGFGQEYLCRPVIDEYRFFSDESVEVAMNKSQLPGYETGLQPAPKNGFTVMGVDIGIDKDDTAISVTEHKGDRRYQRYSEVVTNEVLSNMGVIDPDRGNANHVAQRISAIHQACDVDLVVMDRTGVGETFQRITERRLGRAIMGFNFSDKEGVADMMGDMNASLRNGKITLIEDERVLDEFVSVVKEKKEDHSRPHFSGKDNSESGKDDTVFATVMSCYPPKFNSNTTSPSGRDKAASGTGELASPTTGANVDPYKEEEQRQTAAFGARNVSRGRHSRKSQYSGRSRR